MKTLRFWDYVNGDYVKISLRPGDTLEHYCAQVTDEGYSSERTTWSHDGDAVLSTCETDGRDCDGRMTTYSAVVAHETNLRVRSVDGAPAYMPDWRKVKSSQRDYSAEAMGY